MPPIAGRWTAAVRAEHLVPVLEPLALALRAGARGPPQVVAARAASALLDLPNEPPPAPPWLTAHQVPAFVRLSGLVERYGGALLADAVGLGKSYVALAVGLALTGLNPGRRPGVSRPGEKLALVVPVVLMPQWKRLLEEKGVEAEIISHESLSRSPKPPPPLSSGPGLTPGVSKATALLIVDEAHRFRNPDTRRYQRLAELCVGRRVLLVTATPVHNRLADLFHLFRLFLRDDALTALGVGSLIRAARAEIDADRVRAVAARLTVARSRARAAGVFPVRAASPVIRIGAAPEAVVASLVRGIAELQLGGGVAALLRIGLLRRLASSMPAFRGSLERYRAFTDMAAAAATAGRRLDAADFQRLFPRDGTEDIQLSLLPLVLEEGSTLLPAGAASGLERLARASVEQCDPKAEALERLLAGASGKTIVFTEAIDTARYLLRRLNRRWRVAAVSGSAGWFGTTRVSPQEVLAAFAPAAQHAPPPSRALETDVLIATDLASEGLNLQDAERVVHYDVPWSPARMAQRVGRVDRLGSPHARIETMVFLPPQAIAAALRTEQRLLAKLTAQRTAGSADADDAPLDWCDRLQGLTAGRRPGVSRAGWAQVQGSTRAAVLVVRIGGYADAFVVEGGSARAAPERATELLEHAAVAVDRDPDQRLLDDAIDGAAPAIRDRLRALEVARWRAEDRDRLARRLIPWVLTAARRAARQGDATRLRRLDDLVSRLTRGMTAGEELGLRELVERREPLAVRHLLAWHDRLPALEPWPDAPQVELVAALVLASQPGHS